MEGDYTKSFVKEKLLFSKWFIDVVDSAYNIEHEDSEIDCKTTAKPIEFSSLSYFWHGNESQLVWR